MKNKLVYLTGFMGSGKSTVGPIIANTLGWGFYDLDHVIENKMGQKIRTIFEAKGEEFFRNLETETLKEISIGNELIISLGGGTIVSDINLEILKSHGTIIFLESSFDSIYKRLRYKRDRPVLLTSNEDEVKRDEFIKRITKIYSERKKYYEQADIKINTDKISVGETVDKITKIINKIYLEKKERY